MTPIFKQYLTSSFYVYYWNNYAIDQRILKITNFVILTILKMIFVGLNKPQFMPKENLFKRLYCFVVTTHCSIFSVVECTHWYMYVTELQSFRFLMWQFLTFRREKKTKKSNFRFGEKIRNMIGVEGPFQSKHAPVTRPRFGKCKYYYCNFKYCMKITDLTCTYLRYT